MDLPIGYSILSEYYDAMDGGKSDSKNSVLEKILKKYKVDSVLDLTCGTGSQIFYLAKRGYKVTGSDISPGLLRIARSKAQKGKLKINFLYGDVRTIKVGTFDAVITMFNAVGHLTKPGFEKAMRNINRNLKGGGLYVFDIFNLNCLENEVEIMDKKGAIGSTKLRDIQYSIIDRKSGRQVSHDRFILQRGNHKPRIINAKFSLQGYTAKELRGMLARNGFEVVAQYGLDGSKFLDNVTPNILTVARKHNLTC